tara:strand:+ start:311 stop:1621 length:1311 start_codon:yes stop_codon:yes gene_type:complete
MASTYSTSLRIELQGTGENSGTWGTITNNNFSQSIEFSIAGVVDVACGDNAVTTLTNADGPQSQANNQARNAHIRLTGAHGAVRIAQFPATQKIYLITNATTDSGSSGPYAMTVRLGASGNTLSIANGATRLVATDGTNWYDVFASGGQFGGSFLADGTVDVNGKELILDADADTSLTADTDDQIDVKMANIDVANLTTQNSGDLVITTAVQDKDFVIKGDDGGSGITALTLDMSDAGKATFNGVVDADAGITVDNITIDGTEIDLSSGDLTLDVEGDIILDANGGDVIFQDDGTVIGHITNSSSDLVIESKVSDKDIIFKGNDGGSGITALTLDMSGAGAATFNNDVTAFSDERLKTDIKTIENALEKVSQMRGVTFKRDGVDGTGVIAQEVQPHLPEVIHDKQEYLSVAYGNMVGILIEAIKDLKKQVDELKGN